MQNDAEVLSGGGELGALMRAHDWTTTPLGAPRTWPQSLRTAVRIMLTSRQPIWLGWGPELTYLYNDPYKSIIGGKHPQALGRPFREVWHEIFGVVGPMADSVMTRNEGTYVEAQLLIMERYGYPEETYYTFSYSPVPNDDGGRGGLICANTDDTRRVIGERQIDTLRELAAAVTTARSADDACTLAVEALCANRRDVPFAMLYLVDESGTGPMRRVASSPQSEALHDPRLWPCADVIASGNVKVVSLDGVNGNIPAGAWPRPPDRAAVVPIASSGQHGHVAVLVVGLNPFRQFDEHYGGFLDLASRQVAGGITSAEAYEEERRRAEALAELDRAKTAFFSNVSHEFRTPLTLMMGPLEDLLGASARLSPEDRSRLEVAYRNAARLLKLVNTLLDFSRLESGRLQASYEPTDLAALTSDLVSVFRSAIERVGLRFTVDCAPLDAPVYVDIDMWEKIVFNLLSNALKYTFEGEIAVRLECDATQVRLVVRDTGTGIPAAELPQLFQRFHRIKGARGRTIEGSGIGLALVQELVRLHGGDVAVESEEGRGSAFTVSLPRRSADAASERPPGTRVREHLAPRAKAYVEETHAFDADIPDPASPIGEPTSTDGPARPRIVLAEDNADMRDYVRRLLAPLYDVEATADGLEALAAARRQRPDLVLTDVMMPGLDGFGVLHALRADATLSHVPVIILSARAGEEASIEGMQAGADDYLVKPFGARELLARVAARLELGRLQARVAAERAGLASLFAQTPVPTAVLRGPDLVFDLANDAYRAMVGGRDVQGKALLDALPEMREFATQLQAVMQTGRPHVGHEVPLRLDAGNSAPEAYFSYMFAPLRDERGGVEGVIALWNEVTEQVRARESLRDADRRKDEFLAILSHELRNPLAPLRNSLHLLRMKAQLEESRDAGRAPIYETMERQVNHLVRLVDDLMEMSRINRGTFELRRERVDVASVLRSAVEATEPLIAAAGHRLTVSLPDTPAIVDGDPVRLAQVVANLLSNAAKYTEGNGRIWLAAARDGNAVSITVRDNGAGIAPSTMPKLFEMFSRGDRMAHHKQEGLGIGLALARRLAEMHGGTVNGRSEGLGMGSEFTVRLPEAPAPAASTAVADAEASVRAARVLVVDDNEDAADSMAEILRLLGADVTVVYDGGAALDAWKAHSPSVVLLDIGMPGMDGYEVARRIRDGSPRNGTWLVALTGWGQEDDRRRASEAGFDHHLVKPVDIAVLQDLLASIHRGAPHPAASDAAG